MMIRTLLLAFVFVFNIQTVYATNSCQSVFVVTETTVKPGIESITPVVLYPLPPSFVSLIKDHPITKELKERFDDGNYYSFQLELYRKNFEKTGVLPEELASMRGEAIQSIFVAKVLRVVFPKSEITEGHAVPSNSQVVHMTVADFAERGGSLKASDLQGNSLQMAFLKNANPGTGKLDKSELRKQLGIRGSAKVISTNFSLYADRDMKLDLIGSLKKADPDVIFVSQSLDERALISEVTEIAAHFPGSIVLRASQLDGRPLNPHKKYVIANDTRGKMHAIHGVSDATVTAGAVNLIEAISAGTPNIFFDHTTKYMFDYNPQVFARIEKEAVATKGGFPVKSLSELNDQLNVILKTPAIQNTILPTYRQKSGGAQTPVDVLLGDLKRVIENSH